jgi:transcriptional regulator with XRE-family HTH domain
MDLLTGDVNQEDGLSSSPDSPEAWIGERVHRLRRAKGLTRTELAERLRVSRQRLGNWERGLNTPTLGVLPSLARELGVTVDELITGEPPPREWLSREQREEAEQLVERLRQLLG